MRLQQKNDPGVITFNEIGEVVHIVICSTSERLMAVSPDQGSLLKYSG